MRRVTLTFDNGPTPGVTDHVLDVLSSHEVKATFFVVGTKLSQPQGRALAARAHADGHWIGNHTMSHGAPLGERTDLDAVDREIADMERLMGSLAHDARFFRPNGRGKIGPHVLSPEACDYLIANRATVVLWTHIPRDRNGAPDAWIADAQRASSECDWPLLVLHDRPSGHDVPAGSMSCLARYLDWGREQGIEFSQDFPSACVPILRGRVQMPLEPHVQFSSA